MNFELYSQYYDLLYQDKNYEAEANYIIDLLKQYCPGAEYLLELGCGTGRHAEILCAQGFKIHGIELSADMLKIAASRKIKGFSFEQADIAHYRTDKQYDAVLSLFHVISYLTDTDKLKKSFTNIYSHLNPGGIFVFDVWHTEAVNYLKPEQRIKESANSSIHLKRHTTPVNIPDKNRVDVNFDIEIKELETGEKYKISEVHPMRHFSTPEIKTLAETYRFTMLRSEEFLTGRQPAKDTWGVCYVLQKNG